MGAPSAGPQGHRAALYEKQGDPERRGRDNWEGFWRKRKRSPPWPRAMTAVFGKNAIALPLRCVQPWRAGSSDEDGVPVWSVQSAPWDSSTLRPPMGPQWVADCQIPGSSLTLAPVCPSSPLPAAVWVSPSTFHWLLLWLNWSPQPFIRASSQL